MVAWLLSLTPPADLSSSAFLAYVLFDVFLIVVLARFLGNLMAKVGQPRVVGEILAGIALGPTLLGDTLSQVIAPLEIRATLGAFATLGLILFMFLAGLEFEIEKVKDKIKSALILAGLAVAVPGLLAFPIGFLLHNNTFAGPAGMTFFPFALFIGSALSVTAFPVMAHILMERGELNSPLGGLGVATAGIVSVLMFGYLAFSGTMAVSAGLGDFVINGLMIFLFIGISISIVRSLLSHFLFGGTTQPSIDGTKLAIIFAGMVIYGMISHLLQIHAMVGGFVWGVILPISLELRKEIAAKIRDLGMILFLPIFFAMSGFQTDLKQLTLSTIPAIGLMLAGAVAGKYIPALIGRNFGLSWSEVGKLGALLNTRGLLVLVAGLIGLQLQIITPITFTIFVIVALVTNLMTLPLLNLFSRGQPVVIVQEHPATPAD